MDRWVEKQNIPLLGKVGFVASKEDMKTWHYYGEKVVKRYELPPSHLGDMCDDWPLHSLCPYFF